MFKIKRVATAGLLALMFAALVQLAPAAAQTGPGPGGPRGAWPGDGWGPGIMGPGMMGRGMMGRGGFMRFCDPRFAGFAEWQVDRIERAVKLTDAQRQALDALKTASTKSGEVMRAGCTDEIPATAPARLAAMEKRMEAMLAAIKTVRPAFDAFYATLDEQQKARLDAVSPRGWRWRWQRQSGGQVPRPVCPG